MDEPGAGIPILAPGAWLGALGVFASAYALGSLLSARAKFPRRMDAVLLRLALGIAFLPALVLWLGQIDGFIHRFQFWLILPAAGFGLFIFEFLRGAEGGGAAAEETANPAPPAAPADPGARRTALALEAAGWLAVASTLAILLGPAFAPPMQYDVLEYHLGVLPNFFEARRIAPIPHVFYSAQPISTEMLYTMGAIFERSPWGWSSGLVQWGLIVLAVALLARGVAAWGVSRAFAPWLALIFLAHPTIFNLTLDRMTDMAGAALACAGFLLLAPGRNSATGAGARRIAFLAGVLAGGAVASKWTNAGTAAPILLFVLLAVHGAAGDARASARACAIGAALFVLGAALAFLPWTLWLWEIAGNPFAPFLARWFPTDAWPAARLDFLLQTHDPIGMFSSAYWRKIFAMNARFSSGPPLLLLALLAALAHAAARRRLPPQPERKEAAFPLVPSLALAAGIALAFLLWARLRQSESRFLAPVIAAELLLLGLVLARAARLSPGESLRTALAIGLAVLALLDWPRNLAAIKDFGYWRHALGRTPTPEFLTTGLGGATTELFDAANALPEGSKILAIGEARRFYFRRSVALSSVFDRPPIREFISADSTPESIRESLRAAGYTHLLVNEFECARLLDFHPPPVLTSDAEFMRLRRDLPPADRRALFAEKYPGYAEFGPEPLTDAERAAYTGFLNSMRERASFHSMGARPHPAMWIAPLAP